ncbi:unnamed protein product [Blepharisma stoltei]|uniref:Uncharacterized protein n=1 Tax=Blepharisma stoltei TaxID=1481888 RepID=A0AAU9J0W4_9CILI|nr:unnamed protein product [Blepharisma stoltei]
MKASLLMILTLFAFSSSLRVFKPMFSLLEKENNSAGNLEDTNGTKLAVGSLFLETSSELLGSSADGSSKTGSDSFLEISRKDNSFLQTELTKGGTRVGDMVTNGGYNGNSNSFLQTEIELTKGGTRSGDIMSGDGFKTSSEDFF